MGLQCSCTKTFRQLFVRNETGDQIIDYRRTRSAEWKFLVIQTDRVITMRG